MKRAALAFIVCTTLACHDDSTHSHDADPEARAEHGHDHGGPGAIAVTIWTEDTELFVEFPPLVVGQDSPFAAHLTMLADFSPVATGRVEVILDGGTAAAERFDAGPSTTAGIFRPVARPDHAGPRQVRVALTTDTGVWSHDLGTHTVYASAQDVPEAPEEEASGEIAFLKEQQWKMPFSTALVTTASLRPSIPAFARLAARADGAVTITAPATGRLVRADGPLPVVGDSVAEGDLLAKFVARLEEGADVPTLDLAITAAKLDLQHATAERKRLEGLLADGAVPERRVTDARHAEARAKASLEAAKRRSGQFRRVQKTGSRAKANGMDIRTPLSGTVLEVGNVAGALVEDGAELFRVVDDRALWLHARVPEVDGPQISAVSGAWFSLPGADEIVEVDSDAIVTRGGPVDERTRTVTVTFEVPNEARRLRVGGRVRAHLLVGEARDNPAVPAAAVLVDAGISIVFVQTGGESFERRQVRTGITDRGLVEITEGLQPGERVAVDGAYAVKLAASSTTAPAHGHPH